MNSNLNLRGQFIRGPFAEEYDKKVAILPGDIAPDFSGRTLEGKLISLKDFKGKVVYVDIWASWCGPCVEEIPYAKKLHSAFQEDKVIFLNVSVDRSREAWKKKLVKEKDWLGTHIILDQQEARYFCQKLQSYRLFQNIFSLIKRVKSFRQMLLDRHQKV